MKSMTVFFFIVCIAMVMFLSGCQDKRTAGTDKGTLKVVATIFPLYDFSKHIGKDRVDVQLVIQPGVETHGFEPKPGDILMIRKADIFLYTGLSMEPWIEDIISSLDDHGPLIVDAGGSIGTVQPADDKGKRRTDPHIWLDLSRAQKMVDRIAESFIKRDAPRKDFYLRNAKAYKESLHALDQKFQRVLASCKKHMFVHGGHFAFGYLTKRYNLMYLSAYRGFSPDSEPTPGDLIKLINQLKSNNIKYIFYEELITPKLAKTIAHETGAKLLLLHGGHNVTKKEFEQGVTFISLMDQNLRNLSKGLECQ